MITPRQILLALIIVSFAACSPKQEKASATQSAAAQPGTQYQKINEVPEEVRQGIEAFARQLQQDLRDGNTNAIRAAFDRLSIVDGICEGAKAPPERLAPFKTGLQRGIQTGIEQIAGVWVGQECKFKSLVVYRGSPAARFRFAGNSSGIALVDLVVRKGSQGKMSIVNFCNHALGYDMVEQARQTAAPVFVELDKTFLQRLIDKPDVQTADLIRFGEVSKKFAAGDFPGVIAAYGTLPPSIRDSLAATAMYIGSLQRQHDNAAYKAALKEAAARFKTASFQFMLVDAYFLDKQYDKAVECLDTFMSAMGQDSALLALKALLLKQKGDLPSARTALRQALELEPDCVYAHSKGLDVLLAAKDFAATRDSMIFLEDHAGYRFKGAMKGPIWEEFKQAPESARWR